MLIDLENYRNLNPDMLEELRCMNELSIRRKEQVGPERIERIVAGLDPDIFYDHEWGFM